MEKRVSIRDIAEMHLETHISKTAGVVDKKSVQITGFLIQIFVKFIIIRRVRFIGFKTFPYRDFVFLVKSYIIF